MKKIYTKIRAIVAITMMLIGIMPSLAYDFEVNGIYYNILSSKTAEVTYKDTNLDSYSGDIVIPTNISYAGSTYTVESIGQYAFSHCTYLTSVEIPNSVSNIGAYAFNFSTHLKSIKIGTGVISIGDEAFVRCDSLTDIYIYDLSAWMNIEYGLDATPLGYANNLYLNDELLTDVQIPEGITSINDYAFWELECIESITISSTVKKISLDAFGDCPNLTTVTFNAENCTEMEPWMELYDYAVFSRCSSFSILNIGESVKHIPDYAFSGCENLKDILTLPASLESIGQYAFYGTSYTICKSLATTPPALGENSLGNIKYLYVPLESVSLYEQAEGWKDIEYITPLDELLSLDVTNNVAGKLKSVISDKTSSPAIIQELIIHGTLNSDDFKFIRENMPLLSKLDISDTDLKELPNKALWNCDELTSVEIPNSVTTIGNSVFSNCTGLTSVEIPNSVTEIGNSAFTGCTGLTSVEIPNSVTTIGNSAFSGCTGLTSVIWNPTTITDFDSDSALFSSCPVSEFIFGENVENIPAYLCSTMTNLTSVEIPNSVTTIGNYSFENCSKLESLIIGESVSNISRTAFSGCSKLSDVVWNTITYKDFLSISTNPFNGCPISLFTFGNSVEYIPAYLCKEMTKLKDIKIPDSVTAIGDYVFSDCTELSNITLGNSVVSIGNYIFKNCKKLSVVKLPDSVNSIGNHAFLGCGSLKSIEIPCAVTSIGNYTFKDCTNLTTIVWNTIKCEQFNNNPFSGISDQITSFTFGSSVEFIPAYLCQGMAKVTDFKIPDTVNSIGKAAFAQCSGITNIEIPNLIETIESEVFLDCSKATILKMGANVKTIGANAFKGCNNLKKIETQAVIPPTVENEEQFSDEVYQKCILYVPTGSKEDYKFSYAWSEFYNIEEKDFSNGVSLTNIGNNNNLCISSTDGRILISGANDEDKVQVYTIGGILMAESNVLNIQNTVFNKGIYIVVINGKIHKLVL